jgi:hypothetical protein
MSLTEKKVRDARAGEENRIEWDGEVKGLGLRVTRAGAKAFVLSYRADGRKRLMTLGRTSEIGLARARELAGDALVRVRGGVDPLEEKAQRKTLPTVAEGVDQFFGEYVPKRKAIGRMSDRTEKEYARQANKYVLPKIGRRRIRDVTKGDVERMLAPLRSKPSSTSGALVTASRRTRAAA